MPPIEVARRRGVINASQHARVKATLEEIGRGICYPDGMTPQARSQALRKEADEVLELVRLAEHCADIGPVTFTGSYLLDLMMWPDIDVYLPPTSVERMLALAAKLAAGDRVTEIKLMKGWPEEDDLADGLYVKALVAHGDWGRPWKIDIWSLRQAVIDRKQRELADLAARMTDEQRRLILDYNRSILTDAGRTPIFSGIFTYRAVVNEQMTDFDAITAYLRANGVQM